MAQFFKFHKGLIGLSLSFCIGEMVRNHIRESDVAKIVSATCAYTREEFVEVCDQYAECYWKDFPEEAKSLALFMYDNGRVEQPRLYNGVCYSIADGHWIDDMTTAKEW